MSHSPRYPVAPRSQDPVHGRAVDLDASIALMNEICALVGDPARVVYASSITAIGPTDASTLTDDTPEAEAPGSHHDGSLDTLVRRARRHRLPRTHPRPPPAP